MKDAFERSILEHYAYSPTPPIFMKFSAFVVFLMLITKIKTVFGAKAPIVRYGVPKFQKILIMPIYEFPKLSYFQQPSCHFIDLFIYLSEANL